MANGCTISASATSNSITVSAAATYTGSTWNGYGVSCSISVDGVGSWSGTITLPKGGSPRYFSHTFYISEAGSARTFTCRASWDSSWSSAGGSTSNSCRVTVPARQYIAHGKPTIKASKTTANYGESVTISWAKSATQGNANFDRFELWQGNTKLYSGSAISKSVKPSDVTGAKGGTATYTLKEIHEWYGSYPSTESSVSINVRSGVVSVYDSSGTKHTGLVTAYDSSGNSHFVLITAYDANGSPHSVV